MTRNKDLLPLLSEVIDAEFHQLYPGADKGDKHLFREGARWAWANLPAGEPARAPWPDFMGQPIYHGDRLVHPQDGSEFVAVRLEHQEGETDAWRAVYDGDPTRTSRLCLQIGEKGQAVLSERAAVITPAAPVALGGEPPCNPRPDAPHGYNRNASHNAGRYVCDCEGWAAMGGDKGGAVAWRFRWHPEGDWHLTEKEPRGGDGTTKQPLFAAPVGKARMLTDEEADHITGMHNTGRSQGDSECAEAIQRKFCEVNGITLQGGA